MESFENWRCNPNPAHAIKIMVDTSSQDAGAIREVLFRLVGQTEYTELVHGSLKRCSPSRYSENVSFEPSKKYIRETDLYRRRTQ